MGPKWELADKIGIAAGLVLFVIEIVKWYYLIKLYLEVDDIQEDMEDMVEDMEDMHEDVEDMHEKMNGRKG